MAFLETALGLADLTIYVVTLAIIIREYLRSRNRSLFFLSASMAVFLLTELLAFGTPRDLDETAPQFIGGILMLLGTMYGLTFLVLFVDSFNSDTILTTRNVLLFTLGSALETSLFITYTLTGRLLQTKSFSDFTDVEETIFIYMVVSTVAASLGIFFLTVLLFWLLRKKTLEIENPKMRKLYLRVRAGGAIIIIGPIIVSILVSFFTTPNLDVIDSLTSLVGIFIIIRAIQEGGLFLFHGNKLRKIIIISKNGVPIYGFSFKSFRGESNLQGVEGEILFSGAFRSIGVLIEEFTGSNQQVEKIVLSDMVMTILNTTSGHSIVLMTDTHTTYFDDAIRDFSNRIEPLLLNEDVETSLDTDQIKFANNILATSFGFGKTYFVEGNRH